LDDDIVVVGVGHRLSAFREEVMVNFALSEWKKDVLESAADRFERRLVEANGKLRVDMAQGESRIVRWMFVFWLGQLGVNLTVVAILVRAVGFL
jgi:hypothetical protein